jgi:hypothetical protein
LAVLKSHKKALLETSDLTMLDSVGWGISEASMRERSAQSGGAAPKSSTPLAAKSSGNQAATTATTTTTTQALPKATATPKPAPQTNVSKPVGALPGLGLRAGELFNV